MKTRPNMLLIIPNLGSGGAQRIFHQHRQFFSDDFNVVSCVFNFDGAFAEEKKDNIISLDVPAGGNVLSKVLNFLKRIRKLREIKQHHNIDVTISHLEGADYVNILSRKNDKLILWIHGTKVHDEDISGIIGWFRKRVLLPRLYRRADRIGCVSNGITRELKAIIPSASEKIVTVQNGIDIALVQSKSKEPLPPQWQSLMSKHFVIVTHCRFAAQKNLRALLHVIAGMKDVADLRFILIGDGEQRGELAELARSLGIPSYRSWTDDQWSESSRVFFAGQQLNPFPWLRQANLYVLASMWEGFPLSICEAIACGLPVVASDCPTGPKEILDLSSAGVLMPVPYEGLQKSIDTWIDTLRDLINDSAKLERYRTLANENARLFSSDRSKCDTIAVVNSVLS